MCGRARLSSDVSEIKIVFSIPPERPTPNFPPSWNVAPTDSLPVVRYDAKATQRSSSSATPPEEYGSGRGSQDAGRAATEAPISKFGPGALGKGLPGKG